MKKTIIFLLAALIACSFAFTSCGQSGDNSDATTAVKKKDSPSDVMEKALKTLQQKDYKGIVKYMPSAEDASEDDIAQMAALIEMVYEVNGGLKDYEILGEEISEDGQSATVTTKYIFGNGETKEDIDKLILTENGWLIKE
jgi:hypothetical protein